MIDLLRQHHVPVAKYFGTLVGFELQRTESDILVAILLTCMAHGITVLPIHDAALCPASRAREVEAVMLSTFELMTDAPAAVSKSAS